jgi:hypothetical protein
LAYLEYYKTKKMKKNKTLVTTAVVVVLGAAAYYFLLRPSAGKGGKREGGRGEEEIDQKMLPIANNLFDAMDGYGTGNDTIETELKKIKSKQEWDSLVRAFGTRTISSGTWNFFQSDFTGGLVECLQNELDSGETARVNQILSRIGVSII